MAKSSFVPNPAKIKVIGLGGGGCNAVTRMVQEGIQGVEFIAMNTDAQAMALTEAPIRIQLGERLAKGLGVGGDHALGQKAAEEQNIRSPLQEAGFTKNEIRELARELGLPNWNKPSSACLASRIPYGTPITGTVLNQIEQAENILVRYGINQLRVRHHGKVARIEVMPSDFERILEIRTEITAALKNLGYDYITLDIQGFSSGSMNKGINTNG